MHIGDMQLITSQECVNLPDPNTKLANINSLTMVLLWPCHTHRFHLSFWICNWTLMSNNHHCRHRNSVVFMIINSQHEPLFTKCMAKCGYFTHSWSSYRCIFTTMKCLNCPYNLCIGPSHILLNMIKESKTFKLILR